MNPSYVQTFKRHRLLFSLPVIIMTLLGLWFVLGTPKEYKAGASLLVDTPVTQASSFNDSNPQAVTPAAQTQQLLSELLATRTFRLEVGRAGPLTNYLATHSGGGWGPKQLLKRGSGSAEDRTWNALDAKHVITTLPGGQLLSIELHGPTPEIAVGTLNGLLATFAKERRAIYERRQRAAVQLYQERLDTAQRQLGAINAKVASGALSPVDAAPSLRAATARAKAASRALGQAKFSLEASGGVGPTYHVMDPPGLPAPAVSGMKKTVFGVVGAMFVGCLISLLAIVLLTSSDGRERDDDREREELREVIARTDDDPPVAKATGTNGSAVPHVPHVKATRER